MSGFEGLYLLSMVSLAVYYITYSYIHRHCPKGRPTARHSLYGVMRLSRTSAHVSSDTAPLPALT